MNYEVLDNYIKEIIVTELIGYYREKKSGLYKIEVDESILLEVGRDNFIYYINGFFDTLSTDDVVVNEFGGKIQVIFGHPKSEPVFNRYQNR